MSPDGSSVYVANENDNSVSVISTTSNTVIDTVPVGNGPFGVAITPDGTYAYVSNNADNSVSVIDTSNNTIVATIPIGDSPQSIAIIPFTPPLSPASLDGESTSVNYPFQRQYFNILNWTASPSNGVITYRVYRNDTLIASISASSPLTYQDFLINRKTSYIYSVTSVDQNGLESTPITVSIPN